MRRASLRFICLASIFALTSVALVGCPSSSDSSPPAPTCKSGFRNQCIDDASIGDGFGCALLMDRTVWCWGRNDRGQVGYPTTDLCPEDIGGGKTRSIACHTFPFQVVGLPAAAAIASGDAFSCALGDDGAVRCWGDDATGSLGNGATLTSQSPVTVSSLSAVTSIALGSRHACALADGKVWCWGANDAGQLGSKTSGTCDVDGGSIACATKPVQIADLADVVELSAGEAHTCARTSDGLVTCWGDDRWGQLGDGKTDAAPIGTRRTVLVALDAPLDGVLSLAAGAHHTCALRDGGSVFCWGRADHRELGAPPPGSGVVGCPDACSTLAVEVPGLPSPTPIEDAGVDASSDADADVSDATRDASIDDTSKPPDATSDGATDARSDVADTASDARNEASIDAGPSVGGFDRVVSSGDSFSCVRIADGTVRCWGLDSVGQLGDGRATSDPSGAVLVIASPGAAADNPLQGVVRIRAGTISACAIMNDDSLRCWGSNQAGALGVGQFSPQQGPVPVSW